YNNEFATRIAFADISELKRTMTCDRREFLGRNGGTARPAALKRTSLLGTSGAGLGPCAAFQTKFEVEAGEEKTIVILLGEAENAQQARELIFKYRDLDKVEQAYQEVLTFWNKTLGAIEIQTPDVAMNTLVNRW